MPLKSPKKKLEKPPVVVRHPERGRGGFCRPSRQKEALGGWRPAIGRR